MIERRDSIDLTKSKMSQRMGQSRLLEESRRQNSRLFTSQLESQPTFDMRERFMTQQMMKEITCLNTEERTQINKPHQLSRRKSLPAQDSIMLLTRKPNPHMDFYLRTLMPLIVDELAKSNQLLLQNSLLAGKYVNEFGCLCVIKELLNQRQIEMIIQDDREIDDEGMIIPLNHHTPNKRLGFNFLHYLNNNVSLIKFQHKTQLNWKEIQTKIEQSSPYPVIFLTMTGQVIEFTVPSLTNTSDYIKQMKEFNLIPVPLITHFVFRLSDFNPFKNRQIKQWKLFVVSNEENEIGYCDFNTNTIHPSIPQVSTWPIKIYGTTNYYRIAGLVGTSLSIIGILISESSILL